LAVDGSMQGDEHSLFHLPSEPLSLSVLPPDFFLVSDTKLLEEHILLTQQLTSGSIDHPWPSS
jgi:hypothetical protein